MSILHKNEHWKLEAYYPFTGDATDRSGNGYDGTVVTASLATGKVHPKTNGAYSFDGANDYIHSQNIANLGSDFTILAWANPTTVDATRRLPFMLNENNTLIWESDTDLTGDMALLNLAGATTGSGSWVHVAVTHDSTPNAEIFIDGSSAVSGASVANLDAGGDDTIGCHNALNKFYHGLLDDIKIYTRQLTLGEIKAQTYRAPKKAHIGGFI